MTKPHTFSSFAAESINDDSTPRPDLSLFAETLERLRIDEGTDGQRWPETDLPLGRRMALARVDRAGVGLLTVVQMLHASERCRVAGQPEQHLDEGVVEGLFFACRGLAEVVCREVRPE
ncbi:hypothetical protein [Stenotrophomonas sp. 24(2023)]|uniref:hypothetical protein n=1 Tax=Stenotrophomonas sp. 24(2023) TaxID=3068324 RepID=UPI0027E06B1A|nr:hypothetical protein [Stenotrophomonas sp. 24(2023)]WMJ68910.1 hypothetical protein Q9R17_17275 [Stenotrophomonas sp. 24(2023)]